MTKKDIELVARVLNGVKPELHETGRRKQWDRTVAAFSNTLADENPRFSLGKFGRACETGEGLLNKSIS